MEAVFLEGTVEVKETSGWIYLAVGDCLMADSVFRVGIDTILELSGDIHTITISTPGTFSLEELLKHYTLRSSDHALGRFLSDTLTGIVKGREQDSRVVTLGARAREAENGDLKWLDVEQENIRGGKALLRDEKYEEALQLFLDAETDAFGEEADYYQFYIGYCYALLGKRGPALKMLSEISPDKTAPYYDDWVVVRGQLLYESLAYHKAIDLFEHYLSHCPAGRNRQAAGFFSGLCYRELGDEVKARSRFREAYQVDPESEIGRMVISNFNR
jgi:tetratricopeptide (TPR) repeat protein